MARVRTLTQLIADVRQRADAENNDHVTDAEVTRYINQGIAALHALCVEQNEDEYAAEVLLTVTAGTVVSGILTGGDDPTIAPYKVLDVSVIGDDGNSYPVRRYAVRERSTLESSSRSTLWVTRYRLRGLNSIVWAPPFDRDVTVRVTYVESSEDLVSGSDTFDGRDGWEEWVTLDAAIKILTKEESNPAALVTERALVEQRIMRQLVARDRVEPDRVMDVIRREVW